MRVSIKAACGALCLMLAALAAVAAVGQDVPSDWTVDNTRWTGVLAPSESVEVRNPFGDVRLRAADAGEVEVSAMIQRRIDDPVRPEVRIDRRGGSLTVEVVYPAAPKGDLKRVDVAVFVPAGAPITVRTKDGMIQARGLANDVDFEATAGDVFLATSGKARVSVGKGNIIADLRPSGWADLRPSGWGDSPRLSTRDGDITLTLPVDADAELEVEAPGEIAAPPKATLERRTPGKATVRLGQGTHRLTLQTRRGNVNILGPPAH